MLNYIYIRDNKKFPIGCIAYKIDEDYPIVSYNYSSYNPIDKFSKKSARDVALGRLKKHPIKKLVEGCTHRYETLLVILNDFIFTEKDIPSKVKRGAKRLYKHIKSLNDIYYEKQVSSLKLEIPQDLCPECGHLNFDSFLPIGTV